MTTVAFNIFSGFVSGASFVSALLLLMLRLPQRQEWRNFRSARLCVALACMLLSLMYGIDAILDDHSDNIEQIGWYVVSSFQAILFTSTCVVFVAPWRRLSRTIAAHTLLTLTVLLVCLLLCLPQATASPLPSVVICLPVYLLQIVHHCLFFRRSYNHALLHLEQVYDEELSGRLSWVRHLFYVALGVGLTATVGMFRFDYLYATIFEGCVLLVYAMITGSFINYYRKAHFVVKASRNVFRDSSDDNAASAGATTPDATTPDAVSEDKPLVLTDEEAAHVQQHLDAWVRRRGFAVADLSVEEIVDEIGVSRKQFNAYFKYKLGIQFRSWRREIRIREAMRILSDSPTISVPELMEAVGYNDRSNFHKDFQRLAGYSLSEYRSNPSAAIS